MRCKGYLSFLVLGLLLLGACGDGSGEGSAASEGTDDSTGGGATVEDGVVEVEHRFGTTEVPVEPERIVSLDLQWTDTLLALGHAPVAYVQDPTLGEPPWQEGLLGDSESIEVSATATELPYEQIDQADPDLIVVTYFAEDEAAYDLLSQIAPTVATLSAGDAVDPWQGITEVAGQILGEEAEAQALVDDVEGEVAAVGEDLPGLEGKTWAMANYVPGDAVYVIADPDDGASRFFEVLGMEISPTILEQGNVEGGRVEIGFEQLSLLDSDLLLMLTNGEDPSEISGYDSLPAVEAGADMVLDYADAVALNTPSPLSVPYAIEVVRPALEAAAG